jgi:signal transduction histidine kinase
MLRELMSTKKSYVRYLSHELRTPLNTTFLGIGLLADEIKDSKDPDDQERFNILRRLDTMKQTRYGHMLLFTIITVRSAFSRHLSDYHIWPMIHF